MILIELCIELWCREPGCGAKRRRCSPSVVRDPTAAQTALERDFTDDGWRWIDGEQESVRCPDHAKEEP